MTRGTLHALTLAPALVLGGCPEPDPVGSGSATDSTASSTSMGSSTVASTGTTTSTTDTDPSTSTSTSTDGETTIESTSGDPLCGNLMLDEGEVCDDGLNDGEYDGCNPDCKGLGPHCGDGVLQPGLEICDDGNTSDDDLCSQLCDVDVCAEYTLTPLPTNVQLVLDKSSSMILNEWDADEDPNTPTVTRWRSLHTVVTAVAASLEDQINLGVTLYPSTAAVSDYNEMACVVSSVPEVGCAPHNKDAILAAIPGADSINIDGATPSSAGMQTALMHLGTLDPKVPRAIVFVTDGAANCPASWKPGDPYVGLFEVYDDALPMVIADAWSTDGIPTYVVGIDISTNNTGAVIDGVPDDVVPHDALDDLATKGGRPRLGPDKFYNAKSELDLTEALTQITSDARSCVIAIEEPVFQYLKVILGETVVPQVKDCATDDGWVYADFDHTQIELCGASCEQLKDAASATVQYHCVGRRGGFTPDDDLRVGAARPR